MLTPAQLEQFAEDGFLVLPGAIPAARCLELRRRAVELVEELAPAQPGSTFSTVARPQDDDAAFLASASGIRCFWEDGLEQGAAAGGDSAGSDGDAAGAHPIDRINKLGHALHDLDPVFDAFSRQPALAEVVADLALPDPRLLQSMYIVKAPRVGGEVVWHDDHTYLWTEPRSVVGLWVALDDATEENGCLWAVPGDHRGPPRTRYRRGPEGALTETLDPRPYPTERAVPLPAPRGTLVLLDGLCPHASRPNRSDAPRHAYTVHVISGAADYPADNWLQRGPDLPLRGF